MRVRIVLPGLLSLLLFLSGVAVRAQDALTFTDVALDEAFVITLPESWRVWRQSDYDNFEAADEAAVQFFNDLYPGAGLTTPLITPEMRLFASLPEPPDGGTLRLSVEMLGLQTFAQVLGVTPDVLSAGVLAQALGGDVDETMVLNGRPVAFSEAALGEQPLHSATVLFPEQDQIAVVSFTAPDPFFEANAGLTTFVLSTLRLDGEPLAGAAVLAQTGEPLPDDWTLPGEVVYVEATPEPLTCGLNAELNVNLRRGPGTGFPVIASLPAGTSAMATGQTTGADGFVWFLTGSGGWVRADVIVEDASCVDLPFVDAP